MLKHLQAVTSGISGGLLTLSRRASAQEAGDYIYRQGENHQIAPLGGYLFHRPQIAQLQGRGISREDFGGLS